MPSDWFDLEELSRQLGRDLRELEKLVQRGRIPAHKRGGSWMFQATEVSQWLEQEMRSYSDSQLATVERTQQSPEVNPTIPVTTFLKPELVEVDLNAKTKRSVLESLVEVAGRTWKIWEPANVLRAVQEREDLMSTAFDAGVAVPHPRQQVPESIEDSVVAFARTPRGVPFGAPNASLTDLFFLVVCRDAKTHLQVLARLGRMLQIPGFLSELRESVDNASAYETILAAEQKLA
jgi:PTS system nitrogen regulatory IIA component